MNRREFLQTGAKGVLAAGLLGNVARAAPVALGGSDKLGAILPTRPFSDTGEKLTLLGVGGYHVGLVEESVAPQLIETALEEGVRFFDTAHGYQKGGSEERYGKYLCPKYREHVLLMTKSTARTGDALQEQFELSLKRLRTDYVDLLYIHSVGTVEDVDARERGGVFEKARELQASGRVRYLGFSCHTHVTAALHFLEKIKDDAFVRCCQTPVNPVDAGSPDNSFTTRVLPRVLDAGLSHIAMKSLAGGALHGDKLASRNVQVERYPIPGDISLEENFQFVLSQPVTSWVSGMETPEQVRQNAKIAREFAGLAEEEKRRIVTKVAAGRYFDDPRTEVYKKAL